MTWLQRTSLCWFPHTAVAVMWNDVRGCWCYCHSAAQSSLLLDVSHLSHPDRICALSITTQSVAHSMSHLHNWVETVLFHFLLIHVCTSMMSKVYGQWQTVFFSQRTSLCFCLMWFNKAYQWMNSLHPWITSENLHRFVFWRYRPKMMSHRNIVTKNHNPK